MGMHESKRISVSLEEAVEANTITAVEWDSESGSLRLLKQKNDDARLLSCKPIAVGIFPQKRLEVDGSVLYEFKLRPDYTVCDNLVEICKEAERLGLVYQRSKLQDAISVILNHMDIPTEKGHGAPGVYENSDRLMLDFNPKPITTSQAAFWRQIERNAVKELTSEAVSGYLQALSFWHPYEALPIAGLAAISPFAYTLRRRGVLVPLIAHVSPESGLGKTELLRIFSSKLFGINLTTSNAANTDFRLLDLVNACGCLIGIEEAENLPSNQFSPYIKAIAEQEEAGRRGKGDLTIKRYLSRAVLAFSCNYLPIKDKATLIRLIVVNFDERAVAERRLLANRQKLRGLVRDLQSIGWALAELAAEHYKTADTLIECLNCHEEQLEKLCSFKDPRRARVWAVVYEGLKIWELAARTLGVNWQAPNYEEFARNVVIPNESTQFEDAETILDLFITWFEGYLASLPESDGVKRGEGEIWRYHSWKLTNGEELRGYDVTASIMHLFEKDVGKSLSLRQLGRLAGRVVGEETTCRTVKWQSRDKVVRATWVPASGYDIIKENFNKNTPLSHEKILAGTSEAGYLVTTCQELLKNRDGEAGNHPPGQNGGAVVTSQNQDCETTADTSGNQVTTILSTHQKIYAPADARFVKEIFNESITELLLHVLSAVRWRGWRVAAAELHKEAQQAAREAVSEAVRAGKLSPEEQGVAEPALFNLIIRRLRSAGLRVAEPGVYEAPDDILARVAKMEDNNDKLAESSG